MSSALIALVWVAVRGIAALCWGSPSYGVKVCSPTSSPSLMVMPRSASTPVSAAMIAARGFGLLASQGVEVVYGEEDGRGVRVVGEVAGDGSGVAELAGVVPGEVHAQGGAEAVGVDGDADQAFVWPEAECVSDEAEQVGGGFDGERFHGPGSLTFLA